MQDRGSQMLLRLSDKVSNETPKNMISMDPMNLNKILSLQANQDEL